MTDDSGRPDGAEPTSVPAESGDGRVELPEDWPPETRSLEVRAIAHVLGKPVDGARYIGKITRGTRVAWKRVVAPDEEAPKPRRRRGRKPCPAWVEIEPRGYLCRDLLKPSTKSPGGIRQPVVLAGKLTPDVYFKVRENDTDVYKNVDAVHEQVPERQVSTKVMVVGGPIVDVEGVEFRKTDYGLIEDAALARLWPSKFEGRHLRGEGSVTWPFAWVFVEAGRGPAIRAEADTTSTMVRRASRREIVPVLEERDGFVRIGDSEWIERKHLRVAVRNRPPAGVRPGEQWIDVDLDEQVLVAYEGTAPIFATLVSTGKARNLTPVGTYRVRAKAATTPMLGDPRVPNRYEVSGVPWAVRFADGFYVHGVYWHDGFGKPRSHGCVNVSPKDASFLYEWVLPAAPDGWSEVEVPGGEGVYIRVRDIDNPNPPAHDYSAEEPWNAVEEPSVDRGTQPGRSGLIAR